MTTLRSLVAVSKVEISFFFFLLFTSQILKGIESFGKVSKIY
jgi:hypothetical protein